MHARDLVTGHDYGRPASLTLDPVAPLLLELGE